MEVDLEEPEKAKVGSVELKTTEAAGISKDGQPVQAAMEIGLGIEDRPGNANAGTERLEPGTSKTKMETAWVRKVMKPYYLKTADVL